MPAYFKTPEGFGAGITVLVLIIILLLILKRKARKPIGFDSTSPMVNIKGGWKGIEILVRNRHSRDKDSLFPHLGFIFIPLWVFIFISMLSPLEKNNEGKNWLMFLKGAIILFGAICMYSLIYKLIGETHIIINDNTLIIKKQIHDFGIAFRYKIHKISNLYMSNLSGAPFGYNIKFDYKGESHLLIDFLDEKEAKSIFTELQKHINISPFRPS